MTIFTEDPGTGINQPISNAPAGLGESLLSSLQQGFEEGPVMSGIRFSSADRLANDPNSAIVSKQEADERLKQYGVKSINVPDNGVTKAFLDHVVEERQNSLARQQIAMSAPSGWAATPLNFAASLAGSMADPGNVALALVPFAGEAKAASVAGRFGERLFAGARMGAAQAVATVPLTAQAAAAGGDDFTYGNALESTFFNTMAGGLMHAGGGLIADLVRARRPVGAVNEPDASLAADAIQPEAQPVPAITPDNIPSGVNIPERGTNSDLAAAISSEAESYAYILDRLNIAMSEPGDRTQAFMKMGTVPGTVAGEAIRFAGQYKSFTASFMQNVLGREVFGRGYTPAGLGESKTTSLTNALMRNGNGAFMGAANLFVWATLFGYVSMQAKLMMKGQTPRPADAKTFLAAAAQGGGLGILGDFMFGEVNRMGAGPVTSLMGPAASNADSIITLLQQTTRGEADLGDWYRTALDNTPFLNIFWLRTAMNGLILNRIQDSLDPGSLERYQRRVEREQGNEFLVPPSQFMLGK
ncbi:hypothetical protein [Cronobacter sakazakii]|uniref:hypothetical protein n=1 Tax=Cronobacter sakazakii TaxID=28141 RepID=UPI002894877D|nr:hypothetical protein [Cronobacter sakazakii]MDT3531755.1 hypothetical protein [Cronobacter sakazakii]